MRENKKVVKIYRVLRVIKEGCFGQLILNLRLDRREATTRNRVEDRRFWAEGRPRANEWDRLQPMRNRKTL